MGVVRAYCLRRIREMKVQLLKRKLGGGKKSLKGSKKKG